ESWWLLVVAAVGFLALILLTYHKTDAGWSFSGAGAPIQNKGGVVGAWVADVLLYLFGVSAWWWVFAGIVLVVAGYRRMGAPARFEGPARERHHLWLTAPGFILVLLASAALEALRLYRLPATLPQSPGGAIGDLIGNSLAKAMGFNGATLLLLALFAAGWSLLTGMSWIRLMERVGGGIEASVRWARKQREERRDRQIGAVALEQREHAVEIAREVDDDREPVVVVPSVLEVPKSERVVKERQRPLFMGLELPNPRRQLVRLVELLSSAAYNDMPSPLSLAFGKDIAGKPVIADLGRMPHLLVAGTTGSGKSVALNAMILSLIYKAEPRQVRLILIDPKMLELSVYEGIPHLLAPVVTDVKLAANALNWGVGEMERRYRLMSTLGVRNLASYNARVAEARKAGKPLTNPFSLTPEAPEPIDEMPLIVIVIDELADLMMVTGRKIEETIARIAQKARAAGIHLILATQRPSVDVITGLIKANIPSRIA